MTELDSERPVYSGGRRSRQAERMDDPDLPEEELREALDQLVKINRSLNGYGPTLRGLGSLLPEGCRRFTLLDVGCGSGDTAQRILRWARKRGIEAKITGIERLPVAVENARQKNRGEDSIRFEKMDLFQLSPRPTFDIVHAALLLHHFDGADTLRALKQMLALSRWGVAINDLHRHSAAFYAIRLLTRMFSRNPTLRFDAPTSVARGFKRRELEDLAHAAGIVDYDLHWHWAFRWLLVARKP